MGEELSALFAQHRTAVLGGGAVLVAGLAYLRRKKGAAPAGASAGATVPSGLAGTIPAAAVAPSGGYDSTSYDLYNSLQSEISGIAEQNRQTVGSSAAAAPTPIASTLFQPTYNGNYARTPDGQGVEIESDGSLFHINDKAAQQIAGQGGSYASLVDNLGWYSTTGNLKAVNSGQAPVPMVYGSTGQLIPWAPSKPTLADKATG